MLQRWENVQTYTVTQRLVLQQWECCLLMGTLLRTVATLVVYLCECRCCSTARIGFQSASSGSDGKGKNAAALGVAAFKKILIFVSGGDSCCNSGYIELAA